MCVSLCVYYTYVCVCVCVASFDCPGLDQAAKKYLPYIFIVHKPSSVICRWFYGNQALGWIQGQDYDGSELRIGSVQGYEQGLRLGFLLGFWVKVKVGIGSWDMNSEFSQAQVYTTRVYVWVFASQWCTARSLKSPWSLRVMPGNSGSITRTTAPSHSLWVVWIF